MAVIKSKMKAGEKFSGKFVKVDTDENKVTIIADGKETILSVNAITAEYIESMFDKDDDIKIEFDGVDYDVE